MLGLSGLVSFPASAATFHLAPSGADNAAGSQGAPWKTLPYAYGRMAAGDTVLVRAGTYAGVAFDWNKSGAPGKPMVVKAYPGETPVFQGNGADIFIQSFGRHLVFDGLEVTGYRLCAFNPKGGGKVVIRNCRILRISAEDYGAVTPQYCDSVLIEDNLFEECGRSLAQIQFDHAIYNAAGSRDIIIRGNLFRNNFGGPAINHYHMPSPFNVSIYNNAFEMTVGAERSGIFVGDGAHDVSVFNNTFHLEGKGAVRAYGVSFNAGHGTNQAFNNVFYFQDWPMTDALSPHAALQDSADFNLYWPSKDPEDKGAHSFAADPRFLDAEAGDFRLGPGSPAINAGRAVEGLVVDKDGNKRPIGAGVDIGAYEDSAGIPDSIRRRDAPAKAGFEPFKTIPGRWNLLGRLRESAR